MGAKRDRDELLESIAKSREDLRDEELGLKEEAVEEEQEETNEVEEVEEVEEQEEESSESTEDEVEESQEDEEELVTIKVDGKEEQVPLSKIKDAGIRTFQKETAADKRLQEVSEREKALQQQALLLQQLQAGNQAKPQQPKQDADPRISKWTEAIRYGDEDEAQQALQELIAYGNNNKGPDTDEVLRAVDAQLKTHALQQRLEAPEEQGGYKDVVEDPYLKSIASQQIDNIIQTRYAQTGVLAPATWEDYQAVCNEVRQWKRGFSQPSNTVNLQERAERKKKLDDVKASSARQQPEPEEKPPTTAEIIRDMRKQRAK